MDDYTSPILPVHLHQPYWLATRYWELITTHTLPCVNPVLAWLAFFLDSWSLKLGQIGCLKCQ